MYLTIARLLTLCVAVSAAAACSAPADNAAPVATPAITIARQDAAIGSPVDFTYRFAVAPGAPAFAEDYWVFVHFLDSDGELMWTDDHEPPTPTTQWKPGQTVEYPRTMFIPKFPYVGETRVQVGLFSRTTGGRLPMAGQAVGLREYQVGTFNLRLQSDNVFVVFRDGWHETETADQGSGVEWQWSRKDATLAFRNPKRDATLFLELDQPVDALGTPQRVEIRLGQAAVDSFELPTGRRDLRRINGTAAQFGEAEMGDVTISVDRTFVPATIPAMRSTDPRELGVRVFRAFVQPS